MRRGSSCIATVLGLALGACASAPRLPADSRGEPIAERDPRAVQPERPTVATHAGTVAPGFLEIESGIEADRNEDRSRALLVSTVLKVGLAPRAQLGVLLPVQSATGIALGAGDVAVGVKWRLTDDHPLLARFAVLPSVKLSTGGARGSGTTDVGLLLIDSRSLGPASIDLNAGVVRRGVGNKESNTATFWTVAGGMPVYHDFGWQLEVFGYPGTGGGSGTPPIVGLLTGPTFAVTREFSLDAGIIAPLEGPQPRALYVGFVANLGRIGR